MNNESELMSKSSANYHSSVLSVLERKFACNWSEYVAGDTYI